MTADDLVDGVIALINTALGSTVAIKPDTVNQIEHSANSDLQLFVIAKDEQEEPIGDMGNTCKRTKVVSVAGTAKIDSDNTLGELLGQVQQAREALEGTSVQDYRHDFNAVMSPWDLEAAYSNNRFMSQFDATYYTFS